MEPGLIAHWKFDDDVKDSAGENDGTIKGATFAAGKIGKAVKFDGVDDYVDFKVDEIGALSEGTIAFWFNYESILDKQTVMPIFYIGNDEKERDNLFIIEINTYMLEYFHHIFIRYIWIIFL